jgi:hypothetical protein
MNVLSIRQKITQAIRKMPTTVVLKRYVKVDDGMGGYTLSNTATTIATFDGLLDNSKHGFISANISDSGTVARERAFSLILVYDPTFTILPDDFFEVSNVTYKINNPANILNLNIYWECNLEVVKNG